MMWSGPVGPVRAHW